MQKINNINIGAKTILTPYRFATRPKKAGTNIKTPYEAIEIIEIPTALSIFFIFDEIV